MVHVVSPITTAYDWIYPICNKVEINPYRTALNAEQRSLYDKMLPKLRSGELEIDLGEHSCPAKEVSDIYLAVVRDHPELYFLLDGDRSINSTLTSSRGRAKKLTAHAGMSVNQCADTWRAMMRTIRAIVKCIPAHWDKYQCIRYLYEWFARNVTYDETALRRQSADGALVYRHAVCAGISEAFALVARAIGIPAGCVSVTSTDGGSHRLNVVRIGDVFTYVDCTNAHVLYCDDTGNSTPHGGLPQLTYRYLCFTGQELGRFMRLSPKQKVPLCWSNSFDWFNLNNLQLGRAFYPEQLDNILYSALTNRQSSVEVKCATSQTLYMAERWLQNNGVYKGRFGDALESSNRYANSSIFYSSDKKMRTLAIAW